MIECWKMLVGHLALWSWMILIPTLSLAQNHTCHRTETVEVKVAVPLQEPATFRSYTWCLKVPPRCSKYTVIMRERISYETEVRNQTVSECCPGYVSLYGKCVAACSACVNMRCDSARNCTCAPGYVGQHCNETCESGRWGDRCLETCTCRVGEDCDHATGQCLPSTSTLAPSTSPPAPATLPSPVSTPNLTSSLTINTPHTTTRTSVTSMHPPKKTHKTIPSTPNTFINLSLTEPTTSAEDLTDFNMITRPRTNDSVRHVHSSNKDTNNNNDAKNINILGDLDYPILPTDSVVESFNYIQAQHKPSNNLAAVSSVTVNSSVVNARWISELRAHSSVTLGSALGLLAVLVVTVSTIIRCRTSKATQHQVNTTDKNSLHLVARNSHYAVPGPPSFSFINGYDSSSTKR